MWRVILRGKDTGMEYVYVVDAPKETSHTDVAQAAFRQHGMLRGRGVVSEFADPRFNNDVVWTGIN